jgi:hypothetical protein
MEIAKISILWWPFNVINIYANLYYSRSLLSRYMIANLTVPARLNIYSEAHHISSNLGLWGHLTTMSVFQDCGRVIGK